MNAPVSEFQRKALAAVTLNDRYALATLIGIIPGCIVYSSVGAGFGVLIDRGERPDLHVIFQARILLPLLGLAVLSLVPVIYTRLKGRKAR